MEHTSMQQTRIKGWYWLDLKQVKIDFPRFTTFKRRKYQMCLKMGCIVVDKEDWNSPRQPQTLAAGYYSTFMLGLRCCCQQLSVPGSLFVLDMTKPDATVAFH